MPGFDSGDGSIARACSDPHITTTQRGLSDQTVNVEAVTGRRNKMPWSAVEIQNPWCSRPRCRRRGKVEVPCARGDGRQLSGECHHTGVLRLSDSGVTAAASPMPSINVDKGGLT